MRKAVISVALLAVATIMLTSCSLPTISLFGRGDVEFVVEFQGAAPSDSYVELLVDGKSWGNLTKNNAVMDLPAGERQLTVRADGYYPWTKVLYVAGGSNYQTVRIRLEPIENAE